MVSPNRLGTKYRAEYVDKALASTSSDNVIQGGNTPTQTSKKMFNMKPEAIAPDETTPENNESPNELDDRFSMGNRRQSSEVFYTSDKRLSLPAQLPKNLEDLINNNDDQQSSESEGKKNRKSQRTYGMSEKIVRRPHVGSGEEFKQNPLHPRNNIIVSNL